MRPMISEPLYTARRLRMAAAEIIHHAKRNGGEAWLRDEAYYEDAGAMLAARGFGALSPALCAGRGHIFTLAKRVAA